ncbi:hypothetical protein P3T76_006302 [Phytophthora citrophthora]|uniref:RxLR effector protein n=1 Tax=Phytophthora citrophthora TaxID=4793 RepID=A0AAD9GNQ1_9STRA|nr:hypothetical protein P3T76_006302 [Phytophthora citrophthora]
MRFAAFFSLLVATIVACSMSVAQAEAFAKGFEIFDDGEDEFLFSRRLRAYTAVNKDNVAKAAETFMIQMRQGVPMGKANRMVVQAVRTGDEAAAKRAIMIAASAKEGAKLNDEALGKISAMIAETTKKTPKSWPRLRKFVKVTLGVTGGALAMYGAYKLLFDKKSSTGPITTTTTTGSGSV